MNYGYPGGGGGYTGMPMGPPYFMPPFGQPMMGYGGPFPFAPYGAMPLRPGMMSTMPPTAVPPGAPLPAAAAATAVPLRPMLPTSDAAAVCGSASAAPGASAASRNQPRTSGSSRKLREIRDLTPGIYIDIVVEVVNIRVESTKAIAIVTDYTKPPEGQQRPEVKMTFWDGMAGLLRDENAGPGTYLYVVNAKTKINEFGELEGAVVVGC